MADIARELLQVLNALGDSAAFCATGLAPAVLPGLDVAGVGEVGLPVSAADAKRLIRQAAQAPYGRGEETIVDPRVRRVWQLEPTQFELRNAEWKSFIAQIVEAVRQEFGIARKVEAQLYKLLVYEKGSFFAPHRDSEKAQRMFATLVVCLPSQHEGGTLVVYHDGQTRRINFGGEAARFQVQYAAFYADCQHEITPVTSGYRVCLVYNLSTPRSKRQPSAPVSAGAIDSVAELLTTMLTDRSREKIAIALKHQYTEAGLGDEEASEIDEDNDEDHDDQDSHSDPSPHAEAIIRVARDGDNTSEPPMLRMKGADQAWLSVLARAADKAGCQAFLALLTHWQSGSVDCNSLDYTPNWSRRRRYRDEYDDISAENPSAEFEEVFDESISLSHWFDAAGRRQPFQTLELKEEEIVSDVAEKDRPHHQEIHEATGNEGVSMERWYRQAVVVIWPRDRYFGILAAAGPCNAIPALEELLSRTRQPARNAECREFAREIVTRWRRARRSAVDPWEDEAPVHTRSGGEKSPTRRMLAALQAISDEQLAVEFVRDILPTECDGSEGAELARLVDQHGWRKFAEALSAVFAKQKPDDYGRTLMIPVMLFEALCCRAPSRTPERLSVCRSLVRELEQLIDRWDRRKRDTWREDEEHRVGIVEPVVRALSAIEASGPLERFVARAVADPEHYDLYATLSPTVETLLNDSALQDSSCGRSACERLHQHCLAELRSRTASRPHPPADWSREAKLDCKCADCVELAAFLRNKDESVHRFPRRKELRQHLHQQIDKHHCDVTHITERKGSPQTLVCTKTRASFERRLAQFETDLRLLGELESLGKNVRQRPTAR